MPTSYSDQFYVIDAYAPPAAGTPLNFVVYTAVDRDDNGEIGTSGRDRINGSDITGTYHGDTITVERADGSIATITGTTFYLRNGQSLFTPTDGTVLENATFVSSTYVSTDSPMPVSELGPACFVTGTLIDTPDGPRAIETLTEGDLVETRDSGPQPILWVSRRHAPGDGDHAPIRIMAGALGNTRDLLVSPQHRMLIDGWRAELFFGTDEVLVAAKHLVAAHDRIHVQKMREVAYFHLLLDGHQILYAEGIPAESFDPGGDFARGDPVAARAVQERLGIDATAPPRTARPVVRGSDARVLFV